MEGLLESVRVGNFEVELRSTNRGQIHKRVSCGAILDPYVLTHLSTFGPACFFREVGLLLDGSPGLDGVASTAVMLPVGVPAPSSSPAPMYPRPLLLSPAPSPGVVGSALSSVS